MPHSDLYSCPGTCTFTRTYVHTFTQTQEQTHLKWQTAKCKDKLREWKGIREINRKKHNQNIDIDAFKIIIGKHFTLIIMCYFLKSLMIIVYLIPIQPWRPQIVKRVINPLGPRYKPSDEEETQRLWSAIISTKRREKICNQLSVSKTKQTSFFSISCNHCSVNMKPQNKRVRERIPEYHLGPRGCTPPWVR